MTAIAQPPQPHPHGVLSFLRGDLADAERAHAWMLRAGATSAIAHMAWRDTIRGLVARGHETHVFSFPDEVDVDPAKGTFATTIPHMGDVAISTGAMRICVNLEREGRRIMADRRLWESFCGAIERELARGVGVGVVTHSGLVQLLVALAHRFGNRIWYCVEGYDHRRGAPPTYAETLLRHVRALMPPGLCIGLAVASIRDAGHEQRPELVEGYWRNLPAVEHEPFDASDPVQYELPFAAIWNSNPAQTGRHLELIHDWTQRRPPPGP